MAVKCVIQFRAVDVIAKLSNLTRHRLFVPSQIHTFLVVQLNNSVFAKCFLLEVVSIGGVLQGSSNIVSAHYVQYH